MLAERIAKISTALSPAQARVARLVSDAPSLLAFGTVAEVAEQAGTSPQTVLRLATRLGLDGFSSLQEAVRTELLAQLPQAATRIRQQPGADLVGEVGAADELNLAVSLNVDPVAFDAAVEHLADRGRRVNVVAADSWAGVGALLVSHLGQLRDGVRPVDGPPPRIDRLVAGLGTTDVVLALDVRRYERWVLDVVHRARGRGAYVIALSDGPTSPLFAEATVRFTVGVASPGPFDSAVGAVALVHLLVTGVAARLRTAVTERLDAVEAEWQRQDSLVEPQS